MPYWPCKVVYVVALLPPFPMERFNKFIFINAHRKSFTLWLLTLLYFEEDNVDNFDDYERVKERSWNGRVMSQDALMVAVVAGPGQS